jgi:peptide/nickel transport system ATP-binding protein
MKDADSNNAKNLVRVEGLKTSFFTEAGKVRAVDGVDFEVRAGESLGIVGESGSGKTVTALSLLRLIPDPPGKIEEGRIRFKDTDLLDLTYEQMRSIRGVEIGMIFQEPMTSLNPVFTIRTQLTETLLKHNPEMEKTEAVELSVDMLKRVGISDAERRLKEYPHQYSGGMRQRVMIAMALLNRPSLLIADEPTTALDVTIQAQILDLIQDLMREREGASLILITHDLAVIAETCDRVLVMYGGKIQESADVFDLFEEPLHPYTVGLMQSIPRPGVKTERLTVIPGIIPSIFEMPAGCRFSTRCPRAFGPCAGIEPDLIEVRAGRHVRCHLFTEDRNG